MAEGVGAVTPAQSEAVLTVESVEKTSHLVDRPDEVRTVCWASEGRRSGVGVFDGARRWIVYVQDCRVLYLADVARADGAIPGGADAEQAGLLHRIVKLEDEIAGIKRR